MATSLTTNYYGSLSLYSNMISSGNVTGSNLVDWLQKSYGMTLKSGDIPDIYNVYSALKYNNGFNFFDSIDSYIPDLEASPFGDYDDNYPAGETDYSMITRNIGGTVNFDSNGQLQVGTDSIAATVLSKTYSAANGFDKSGSGKLISNMSQTERVALYKKVAEELQGLKEFTLTNQDILDLKTEILNLNDPNDGAGGDVADSAKTILEAKITALQNQLPAVFMGQLEKEDTDKEYNQQKLNGDVIALAGSVTAADIKTKLFGSSSSPDFMTNDAFYKYVVALKSDSGLEFVDSINESITSWSTNANNSAKVTALDDSATYEGIKKTDLKLGPADILNGLYVTQQLIALYKQYEEVVNQAASMDLSWNMALQNSVEFDYRKELAAQLLSAITASDLASNTDFASSIVNETNIINSLERGCSSSASAHAATSTHAAFDGYYGDVNTSATPTTGGGSLVDPYVVTINGTQYVFGKDSDSNGTIDDISEIFGVTDSRENPFESLLKLDMNKDGMVSRDELIRSGIVLQAVSDSGRFTQSTYNLSLVKGIDLSQIDKTASGNSVGSFAMKLSNGSTVKGLQTFDDQAYFNNLFGTLVDLRPYQGTTSSTTSSTSTTSTSTKSTTSTTTDATQSQESTDTTSNVRQTLLDQLNSAYSGLIIDDTSNVETILDNVCWKKSAYLTPAQRIRIVDSIDPLLTVSEIERKIETAMKSLNLSA